ncbi:unnamed protein product [Symbiodinium sp. KB8]|nr:unnamed protein product [Symbiodinium sp. KB8]
MASAWPHATSRWQAVAALLAAILAVEGPMRAQAVAMHAEARVAGGNPIRKIIDMLETMRNKVQAEGDEKSKIFDKYQCYCKSTFAKLTSQMDQVKTGLPQLRSRVREVAALQATLESEVAQHKKDRDETRSTMESASALRKKESEAYLKDSASEKQTLDSVKDAIEAIEKGQGSAFLQTQRATVLRRLSVSAVVGEQPATGRILGMLKQMKEEISDNVKELVNLEKQRISEHESLLDAKQKEGEAATKAMEEKMLRLGELKVEMQTVKDDIKDKADSEKESSSFFADLKKTCDEKQQAWNAYQSAQAEELRALTETVEFLEKNDVQGAVRGAMYKPSLMQKSPMSAVPISSRFMSESKEERGNWVSLLQMSAGSADEASRSQKSDYAEMALRGSRPGLEVAIQKLDELHDVLDTEQASDEERQQYCQKKLGKAAMVKQNKERDIEDATTIMATYENELSTVVDEMRDMEKTMKELDEQVAEVTNTRKSEHEAFVKSRETNNAALELLDVAAQRIERFYSGSLLQERHAMHLASASRQGRTKDAPDVDLTYRKQGGASTQILMLFNRIKADLQKQMATLESEDKVGQAEYENIVENSNKKKTIGNENLGSKQAAKAELQVTLQRSRDELRSDKQALLAVEEEIQGLHAECDFLLKNFDMRQDVCILENHISPNALAWVGCYAPATRPDNLSIAL